MRSFAAGIQVRAGRRTMTRLRRSWDTWRNLSWDQRRLFVQAWLLLPLTVAALRLFGFRRTQDALLGRGHSAGRVDMPAAQAAARILHSACRWCPFPANCLVRSLVLCRLLNGWKLTGELRIGVAQPEGRLIAHAWVEHEGVVLNDSQDVGMRFAAFDRTRPAGGLELRRTEIQ